jgi:tetratricopeptide (TPR) repeat protein
MPAGWLGLDWGDVPTWIGSVVTSGSVLVAALAYRRSVSDKERDQASQIGAWVALITESGKERRVVRVNNISKGAVFEVIIRFPHSPDLKVSEIIAGGFVTLEFPENYPRVTQAQKITVSTSVSLPFVNFEASRTEETVLGEESPEIQFRDAVGRWWRRDSNGRLSKISGPTRITTSSRFSFGHKTQDRTLASGNNATVDEKLPPEREASSDLRESLNDQTCVIYAGSCLEEGKFADAIRTFERLLARREQLFGYDNLSTLLTRESLAGAYLKAGRTADAMPIFERLYDDWKRVLSPYHPETLRVRDNFIVAHRSVAQAADAIPEFKRILSDQERVLGPHHSDTLRTRENLADAYLTTGRVADAIQVFKRILADREQAFGSDRPDALRAREKLANACLAAGGTG